MTEKYSIDLSRSRIASFRNKIFDNSALSPWVLLVFFVILPVIIFTTFPNWVPEAPVAYLAMFAVVLGFIPWYILCAVHAYFLLQYAGYARYGGTNNDRKSVELTSKVIAESNEWIIFYDYGENTQKNIYSSSEIRDLLLDKLNGADKFRISIIFSKPAASVKELSLVKSLLEWQAANKESPNKVLIRSDVTNSIEGLSMHDMHYKINDTGYAYLTQHKEGERRRKYTLYTPYAGRPIDDIDDCVDFHNLVVEKNQKTMSH